MKLNFSGEVDLPFWRPVRVSVHSATPAIILGVQAGKKKGSERRQQELLLLASESHFLKE